MIDFSQLFFDDAPDEKIKMRPDTNQKGAKFSVVPEAPVIATVPDIDTFLSGGDNSVSVRGDNSMLAGNDSSLLDLHSSQWFTGRQKSEIPRIYQVDRKNLAGQEEHAIDERGDSQDIDKDDINYQIIPKSQIRQAGNIRAETNRAPQSQYGHLPVAGGMKLRSVREVPERFQKLFNFPYFNIVQSRVFDDVLYTDRPLVLCSPTGSGKTVVFEIAMIRLLMTDTFNRSFKIVYMAPIKALCSERYLDWREKLEPFGLRCMELTGDTDLDDFYELQAVNVIFTTPEKWDSMTRKWRDNQSVMQAICLFFIDEIHVLNDPTRGATIEAVVTRMKTIQAARSRSNTDPAFKQLRFIAVSATITNIEDVSEWLGSSTSPAIYYKMDDSVRPVRLRKVVLGYFFADNKRSEFQFDMTLSYKLAGVINTYAENKPTLVFCSTRKGTQQAADILVKDVGSGYVRNAGQRQQLASTSYQLKDSKLRDLVCKGVAYHHAGMDLQDRKHIEETFQSGVLPVLIATSTLAMGVNLPAHLVIVKATMYYNMGVHQEYSDTQVLQMIGRAGRPQFDTSATAVIMTKNQTKMQYENLVNGTQLIESTLHKNLIEHLNAEIVLRTINDISVAVEWLKHTFLYIRVMKNPRHYGMPMGLTRDSIEKRLQDMCVTNLNELHRLGLIHMDEETLEVAPTETGRLMARYCLTFTSMELLLGIKGAETMPDLLSTISKCHEFADIQLRISEKKTLNSLNRDKNRLTIRYPLTGKIKTTDMKVNCLVQATFGCLLIQDFALQQDTSRIFRAGIRVTRCLAEFLSQRNDHQSLRSALQLSKCFKARLWEDSKYVSKQLEGIGPTLSTALVNAGLTSFEKIEQTNPREIELIVNRHPPFGNQVQESVSALPRYELMIEQVTRYSIDSAEIIITIQLSNRDSLKDKPQTNHTCTLLVGDADNTVVYKQRIMDCQLIRDTSWSKKLDVRRSGKGAELAIHYISQDRVGLDVECTYTPNYLGGKIITNSTSISPKVTVPLQRPGTTQEFLPCHHSCHDKQSCAHECCKSGVSAKRRQKTAQPAPKSNSTRPVTSHMNEMRNRLTSLPQTPSLKRPKLQFSEDLDLSRYAYTPRKDNSITSGTMASESGLGTMTVEPGHYGQPRTSAAANDWAELDLYQRHREHGPAEPDQAYLGEEELPALDRADLAIDTGGTGTCQQLAQTETYPEFPSSDDIAQETDYGIMYMNGQDRTTIPATWEERIEGDIRTAKQQSQKRGTHLKRQYPTQGEFNQALKQKLGKPAANRQVGKENISMPQKAPRQYDAELNGIYGGYGDEYQNITDGVAIANTSRNTGYHNAVGDARNVTNCDDTIEVYDSDQGNDQEEQKDSKWTSFFSSQSSTASDYLNEQYPVRHDGMLVEMATHMTRLPGAERRRKVDENGNTMQNSVENSTNTGVQTQKVNGSGNMMQTSIENPTIAGIKGKKVNGSINITAASMGHSTQAGNRWNICKSPSRGIFTSSACAQIPSIPGVQKTAIDYKKGKNDAIFGRKMPHNAVTKTCDNNLAEPSDSFQQEYTNHATREQSHKYGQVLAWVTSSQSEPDWDEWSDEYDMLDAGLAAQGQSTGVNTAGHVDHGMAVTETWQKAPNTSTSAVAETVDKGLETGMVGQRKPVPFTFFFGSDNSVQHNTSDNLTNIFEGIL